MSSQQTDQLVKMANQIALNIGAHSALDVAAKKTGDHIRRFWTVAMQEQLRAYWQDGGGGVSPVVVRMLEESDQSN